jgi:NAD(P)-dependent dehydrogenase (short-subunit alcohol dehydrogenase family)
MSIQWDFKDKTIVITGGASGIGYAAAQILAAAGANISIADVQAGPLKAAVTSLSALGGHVIGSVVDVRDVAQVTAWISETVEKFGKLDGAVNMAGIIPKNINIDDVETMDSGEWIRTIDINLTGVMNSMKAQIKEMKDGASIVNAASIGGIAGFPKNSAYSAAKHGVIGLSRSAAKEVGVRSIRVNAIAPWVSSFF